MTALPGVLRDGGVLRIDLPGTPLDAALARSLRDALPPPDDLDAPVVVLLAGPPGSAFAPLGAAVPGELPPGLRDGGPDGEVARCVDAVAAYDGVVVAALVGDAEGCGAELAIACDLRVAWTDMRLHFPHVAHGVVPACGATQRLPRLCGPGAAARALLLGEDLRGGELPALGLAVVAEDSPAATLAAAAALAERLAALAPQALRACREAMRDGADLPLRDGLRLEADLAVLLQTTHDRGEGISAFLARRAPRFTGE